MNVLSPTIYYENKIYYLIYRNTMRTKCIINFINTHKKCECITHPDIPKKKNVSWNDKLTLSMNVSYELILTDAKNEKYSQGFLPGSYSFSFCYITRVVLGSCKRTERS